jgi:hypothetical protein
VAFELDVHAAEALDDFVFGVMVSTPRGETVWGTNTDLEDFRPRRLAGDATVRLACPELRLAPGEYLLDVAVHSRDGVAYDYWSHALAFTVTAPQRAAGVYLPRHGWEFAGGVGWEPDGTQGAAAEEAAAVERDDTRQDDAGREGRRS